MNLQDTTNLTNSLMVRGHGHAKGNNTGFISFTPISTIETIHQNTTNLAKQTTKAYVQPGMKSTTEASTVATDASVSFPLWITHLAQNNELRGEKAQSKLTRHFYPRSYGPGDFVIEGIARSQVDYQKLAQFIRQHHKQNLMSGVQFAQGQYHIRDYKYLMNLTIPSEQIYIMGWVPKITLSKRGVFEPVPKYKFSFTIAWQDLHSSPGDMSRTVRAWYAAGTDDLYFDAHIHNWDPGENVLPGTHPKE